MFNLAILTGRLTANPELKTTQSGLAVCSFCIAVDRPYSKGEEKQTDFINIVAWRKTAEFVSKYFQKGSLIGIEGSIQTRNYEDKNGNKRTAFEVIASQVHFVESKKAQNSSPNDPLNDFSNHLNELNATNNTSNNNDFGNFLDDDLPF